VIDYTLYDDETERELTGSAQWAIVIADGEPKIVGAAPQSQLYAALLGLAESMVGQVGPARIPVSRRWQAVHAAIAELRAAEVQLPAGARPPITATDVLRLVEERLGSAALRDVQEAVFELASGRIPS